MQKSFFQKHVMTEMILIIRGVSRDAQGLTRNGFAHLDLLLLPLFAHQNAEMGSSLDQSSVTMETRIISQIAILIAQQMSLDTTAQEEMKILPHLVLLNVGMVF